MSNVTASQFEAVRNVAVAALRLYQQHRSPGLYLQNLMPDHFSDEDFVTDDDVEKAINILNSINTDLFLKSDTDPEIGSTGWLNAALNFF